MNLIQIQDRLKGMPMQAVMAYANGQNPEVPPYLALGELNRRKQMEQQSAQPPKASVKDEVEQSLMARNALQQRMQGVPQPMQTTGETAAMPPAPQPGVEEEYAMGGVVALPVRNEMFNYASGGIIAFGGDETKNDKETGQKVSDRAPDLEYNYETNQYEPVVKRRGILENIARMVPGYGKGLEIDPLKDQPELKAQLASRIAQGAGQNAPVVTPATQESNIPAANATQTTTQTPPPTPPAIPPVQQIPNSGIAANPAGNAAAQFLARNFQQAPVALNAYEPPAQGPLGEKWEKYLGNLAQQDAAAQEKFKEQEQQRAKSALWKSLIAAGEATRGGGGIGSLLGGYGKSAIAEEEAAMARESEQDKLMRERQFNNAKMNAELENLRRAEKRGDAKDIYESQLKIREIQNRENELKMRSAEAIFRESEANKRANLSHAGSPSEIRFINDWMARNPGKTYSDAYTAYKMASAGTAGERQDLAELKALQKTYIDQADMTKNPDKASREEAARRLAVVNRQIERMAGVEEPAKVMSMADVAATAKSSGKTEQQVIDAAKARGYTIK